MRPIDADAALKALRKCQTYLYDARDSELKIELSSAEAAINNLPTIQPEKTQPFSEGTTSDMISRQAAIDDAHRQIWYRMNQQGMKDRIDDWLKNLPSVQPEVLACGNGELVAQPEPTDIDAREAVYNLAEKIGIHQLYALTVELRGEPIQPEPQWIPVSERMPEESKCYIITANDGVGHRTTFAKFQKKAKSWDLTGARSYWRVIAWMPLPKPFEGGIK